MMHVLWNSNLLASKGFLQAVRGCIRAREFGLEISLDVAGVPVSDEVMSGGSLMNEFRPYCADPFIRYYGALPREELNKLLLRADVVLLPSMYKSECQPLALIEAMVAGCEIIACNTPEMMSTMRTYPFHIVEQCPISIANALIHLRDNKLATDEDKRTASLRFSRSRFERQLNDVIERCFT